MNLNVSIEVVRSYLDLTGCVIGPAEDSVENSPSLAVEFTVWVAAVKMPDISLNTV